MIVQKHRRSKSRSRLLPVQAGQVWETGNYHLQIGQVGKRLVQYRRYKGSCKGVPTSLASIPELEKYLRENKATLVQE